MKGEQAVVANLSWCLIVHLLGTALEPRDRVVQGIPAL